MTLKFLEVLIKRTIRIILNALTMVTAVANMAVLVKKRSKSPMSVPRTTPKSNLYQRERNFKGAYNQLTYSNKS